jgi:hypothetical protein
MTEPGPSPTEELRRVLEEVLDPWEVFEADDGETGFRSATYDELAARALAALQAHFAKPEVRERLTTVIRGWTPAQVAMLRRLGSLGTQEQPALSAESVLSALGLNGEEP